MLQHSAAIVQCKPQSAQNAGHNEQESNYRIVTWQAAITRYDFPLRKEGPRRMQFVGNRHTGVDLTHHAPRNGYRYHEQQWKNKMSCAIRTHTHDQTNL